MRSDSGLHAMSLLYYFRDGVAEAARNAMERSEATLMQTDNIQSLAQHTELHSATTSENNL